ncbi:MAG: amidohydrolase family protein [Tenericutes bacterium]|jgi:cytosine/adenosine deaminase-related metal-dependent hydrolase|nr:amidohydrolase family protein [Mycoplasmatota bacterium]
MYALIHANIYDYKQYIEDGYIVFDQKIKKVGKMDDYQKRKGVIEINCFNKLIIPGFVSGHTHLYSTFARGASLAFNPKNFLDILKQMWWKIDHFLDLDMIYYSALMGGIDQLMNGTTTLIDHHASFVVKDSLKMIKKALVEDLGLRAILAFETSDRFDVSEAIKENMNFISNNHSEDTSGLFGMHASLSLSDDSLNQIKDSLNGFGIHIHVAESQMDEDECLKNYQMRVVERLDKYHLINDKSLLVHCTHINEDEMDIIKERKATIAINPTSNLNNAVGISNIKRFMDKGIRVIIGNDGLTPSQPFEYMNTLYLTHLKNESPTAFGLDDLKQLIINTYEYTNEQLSTQLGKIEENANADLLVVPYKPYTPMDETNVFGHMFYGIFPGFKPEKVFAKGQLLVDQFTLNYAHKEDIEEANRQSMKLWNILKKEGKNFGFKNEF